MVPVVLGEYQSPHSWKASIVPSIQTSLQLKKEKLIAALKQAQHILGPVPHTVYGPPPATKNIETLDVQTSTRYHPTKYRQTQVPATSYGVPVGNNFRGVPSNNNGPQFVYGTPDKVNSESIQPDTSYGAPNLSKQNLPVFEAGNFNKNSIDTTNGDNLNTNRVNVNVNIPNNINPTITFNGQIPNRPNTENPSFNFNPSTSRPQNSNPNCNFNGPCTQTPQNTNCNFNPCAQNPTVTFNSASTPRPQNPSFNFNGQVTPRPQSPPTFNSANTPNFGNPQNGFDDYDVPVVTGTPGEEESNTDGNVYQETTTQQYTTDNNDQDNQVNPSIRPNTDFGDQTNVGGFNSNDGQNVNNVNDNNNGFYIPPSTPSTTVRPVLRRRKKPTRKPTTTTTTEAPAEEGDEVSFINN